MTTTQTPSRSVWVIEESEDSENWRIASISIDKEDLEEAIELRRDCRGDAGLVFRLVEYVPAVSHWERATEPEKPSVSSAVHDTSYAPEPEVGMRRYTPWCTSDGHAEMVEAWDGAYVRCADHDKLIRRIERLTMNWVSVASGPPPKGRLFLQRINFSDGDVLYEVGDAPHSMMTHWAEIKEPE